MGDSQPQAPQRFDRERLRGLEPVAEEPQASGHDGTPRPVVSGPGGNFSPPSFHRQQSSDESHETAQSDPRMWFDRSNRNPTATYELSTIDADPPFFQKETDLSNDEPSEGLGALGPREPPSVTFSPPNPRLLTPGNQAHSRPEVAQSSSADDFRSVIDDLTIENKRLKEELKRYKQFGTDLMRKDRLFEIKVHGLPGNKKRELEATLRGFAASLGSSTTDASSRRKSSKLGAKGKSPGGSFSKHASSSSSRSRPVDSAYASMSTGATSGLDSRARAPFGHATLPTRARTSNQKVESYLQDIPEGLYPQSLAIAENDKKKLVVRRLEQLFTGEVKAAPIGGMHRLPDRQDQSTPGSGSGRGAQPTGGNASVGISKPPAPIREARMQNLEEGKTRNVASANSTGDGRSGDGVGSGGGSGSSSGSQKSPQGPSMPEQRPTRPRDVDPDRVQVPAENVEYIRHLGMVPPDIVPGTKTNPNNMPMDADGWVYLNLLCNLAQLHIINVTPAFIRSAVSSMSSKFQLSPDGRKIRWRGGTEGTKFSSDSGNTSSKERSTDEDEHVDMGDGDGDSKSAGRGLKRKLAGDSRVSSKNTSKLGPLAARRSTSLHYKPLFVRQSSSFETGEESNSQGSMAEDSNQGNMSRWGYSGSGSSARKRRRVDGAIVYYTGAPFCTDLSGDPGDISPTTYLTSTNQAQTSEQSTETSSKVLSRTLSGSYLPYRPLSDARLQTEMALNPDSESGSELAEMRDVDGNSDSDIDMPLASSGGAPVLEACGLGGVLPDDHFAVLVTTQRLPRHGTDGVKETRPQLRQRSRTLPSPILRRLGLVSLDRSSASDSASTALSQEGKPLSNLSIEVEYVSARLRRLEPVSLPPAAMFFPPFSSSSSDVDGPSDSDSPDSEEQDVVMSRSLCMSGNARVATAPVSAWENSHDAYPEGEELSATDEEDEAESDSLESGPSAEKQAGATRLRPEPRMDKQLRSTSKHSRRPKIVPKAPERFIRAQSSAATAGGAESGYSSSFGK